MKSIQTKIIILSMFVIILCSGVIGGIGLMHSQRVSDENSAQIMNLSCREEGKKIDQLFYSIEQSVKIIAHNSVQSIEMVKILQSDTLRKLYTEELSSIVLTAANSTKGAMAVYVHFNPEIAPPDSGLFYSKSVLNESFKKQKVTDLSKVKPEDTDTMDWYYKPVEAKEAVWLSTYDNGKSEEEVISYVMPIYQDRVLIGVAGMDILFSDLIEEISGVKVYDTGYAFLVDKDNKIHYHPLGYSEFKVDDKDGWNKYVEQVKVDNGGKKIFEFEDKGEKYKLAFCDVENGMRLMLTAPKSEIDAEKNELVRNIVISVLGISAFGILFSVIISQSIIRPLKELTEASKQIATGNFKVEVLAKSKDEVGELSSSLQQTVDCLRVYMDRISDLAYTDSLTGVKSKTAYGEEVRRVDDGIRMGFNQFGIMMFDINGLKEMNDNHGHDAGDNYIRNSCRLICSVFKHSPVFRIGGDEFVAILRGQDLLKAEELLYQFYERTEQIHKMAKKADEKVSIAAGMAVFKDGQDCDYHDVFKRADENMYRNKKAMKAGKEPVLTVEKLEL